MATKSKCPHCGENPLGKPANQRGVRCEYCWGVLEIPLEEAGLDSDGNPVETKKAEAQPAKTKDAPKAEAKEEAKTPASTKK